jgi:hypothetical protein
VYDPVRDAVWFFGAGGSIGSTSIFEWEGRREGWPIIEARVATTLEPSVLLEWSAPPGPTNVRVMRRSPGGAWAEIGFAQRAEDGVLRFEDASVDANARLLYRLAWPAPGGQIPVGEVEVTTEAPAIAAVRLRRNPTQGSIAMDVDLPRAGPVHVRLFDVSGRVVRHEHFTAGGAGRRSFELGSLGDMRPGLYFLEVESPAGIAAARVTLLR